MNEIETRIHEYVKSASTIKTDWYTFITNKDHPLAERWRTFLLAPDDWRRDVDDSEVPLNHASCIFDSPYDDFDIDRHQSKSIDDIIERLQDKADSGKHKFTQDDVNACMEEAMLELIGRWTWDW
jgi:hypothetical protein